jgi:hypothetical protein
MGERMPPSPLSNTPLLEYLLNIYSEGILLCILPMCSGIFSWEGNPRSQQKKKKVQKS